MLSEGIENYRNLIKNIENNKNNKYGKPPTKNKYSKPKR